MSSSNLINKKLFFIQNKIFFSLLIIGLIGFSLRLCFFDFEIPIHNDALGFFFYASDASFLGNLPPNYSPANNGWPAFLSIIFSFFKFEDTLSYMNLQRLTSIIFSSLTIIPLFYLCNRFFAKKYCIVAVCIFAFEPRLIQNSILGISDPLYIFLLTSSLALFLSSSKKLVYFSFIICGLATLVRSEGLFLFLTLSIIFFIRFRKDKLIILKYIFVLSVFVLILFPMALYKIDATGTDNFIMRIFTSASNFSNDPTENQTNSSLSIITGIENFPKYLGWDLIPIFIFFVPIGFFMIFKDRTYQTLLVISSLILMSLPAFYAYSIPLHETRYFYFLYPLFCIISLYPIKKIIDKFNNQKIILLLIIFILLLSVTFLIFKMDVSYQHDAYLIANYVSKIATGVNDYSPESIYLETTDIPSKWNNFNNYFLQERFFNTSIRSMIDHNTILFSVTNFNSLEDFISEHKESGLSHLVIDGSNTRSEFLNHVFIFEEEYSFLIKQFDSKNEGYVYDVKIFKIDYDKFELFYEKLNENP